MGQVGSHPQTSHLLTLMGKVRGVLSQVAQDTVLRSEPGLDSLDDGDYSSRFISNKPLTWWTGECMVNFYKLTLLSVNSLLVELVTPHALSDLVAALAERSNLTGKSAIDIDGDRVGGLVIDGLVEVSRDTRNQSDQVRQGQNQLLLDILRDIKKLSALQQVNQYG